jgi:hypothetical protein
MCSDSEPHQAYRLCRECAEAAEAIVKGQAEKKAYFEAHMESQMHRMIELMSAWGTLKAEVAAAEKVMEAARVRRIQAQQNVSDYFMDIGRMCVFRLRVFYGDKEAIDIYIYI